MANRISLVERAAEIGTLEEGWYESGTPKPDKKILNLFVSFLDSAVKAANIDIPYLYPTLDGGAQAEWSLGSWEVSATVTPSVPSISLQAVNVNNNMVRDVEVSWNDNGVQVFCILISGLVDSEKYNAACRVANEALRLMHSGYDGPFMGEPIEELFKELNKWDVIKDK